MERELTINLTMNKSRADAAGAAFAQAEKARIAQTLSAAELAEVAKSKVIERENQRRVQAQVGWLEAVQGLGTKSLNDLEVKEQAKSAIVDKENRRRIDAIVKAATVEEQKLTEVLTKEQVTFQARDALVRKHNQARIDAEIKATEASKSGWSATSDSVGLAAKAVGSFAFQMLGLNSIQSIVGTIADNFQRAKDRAMDAAKFVQDYREALLELAALKGQLGETGKTVAEELKFRGKTLQTANQAREFQLGALGTGQAAMDTAAEKKLIAPGEFQKALVLGGKFQAVENESAETHGRLIGSIPTLFGRRMTGQEVFQKEQQLFNINQPGGSSFGSAMDQYLKNAPLVTSGILTPERSLALQSAYSIANPGGAGTNVQQFTRATAGGLGRMRGMQGIDGEPNEKWAQYLRRIGATDQMDPLQIGDKIAEDLDKEEAKATSGGKKFNPLLYIQTHGMGNMEDANALLAYRGFRNESLKNTFLPLAERTPTAQEAIGPIERARRDVVFQGRRADISDELAKFNPGAGKEETLNNLFRLSFNRLQGNNEVEGTYKQVMDAPFYSPTEFMYGYRAKTEMEAQNQLAKEARRVGVNPNIPVFMRQTATGMKSETRFVGRDRLYELSQQVQAAGGDPMAGFQADVASAVNKLNGVAEHLNRAAENLDRASAPQRVIQGRPAVQTR